MAIWTSVGTEGWFVQYEVAAVHTVRNLKSIGGLRMMAPEWGEKVFTINQDLFFSDLRAYEALQADLRRRKNERKIQLARLNMQIHEFRKRRKLVGPAKTPPNGFWFYHNELHEVMKVFPEHIFNEEYSWVGTIRNRQTVRVKVAGTDYGVHAWHNFHLTPLPAYKEGVSSLVREIHDLNTYLSVVKQWLQVRRAIYRITYGTKSRNGDYVGQQRYCRNRKELRSALIEIAKEGFAITQVWDMVNQRELVISFKPVMVGYFDKLKNTIFNKEV